MVQGSMGCALHSLRVRRLTLCTAPSIVTFRDWTFGTIGAIVDHRHNGTDAMASRLGATHMTALPTASNSAFPAIATKPIADMSKDELLALVTAMQAQPAKRITLKVGEKGGLSVYGLGRFPVSLYRSQWERLLAPDTVAQINAFIEANASLLTVKA